MRLLAIDPGTRKLGYALFIGENSSAKLKYSGVITIKNGEIGDRLNKVHKEFSKIFDRYRPDVLAIERPFFRINAHTLIRIAESRGVILQLAGKYQVEIFEYPPATIKKNIAGKGNATKGEVGFMAKAIFNVEKELKEDEADAIAIGLCHLVSYHENVLPQKKSSRRNRVLGL